MNDSIERQRLKALFVDLERLAVDPRSDTAQFQHELKSLQERLSELEAGFARLEREGRPNSASRPEPAPPAEPETETTRHRTLHEGWASFLDAIQNNERIGYLYDQSTLTPHYAKNFNGPGYHQGVEVQSEHVGDLYVNPDPGRGFTGEDQALVDAVARQVAQQVENLRLLKDASHARLEAEQAMRQAIRENWQSYANRQNEENSTLIFAYDGNQVSPQQEKTLSQELDLNHPLQIRGETIGWLSMAGVKNLSADQLSLVSQVASQMSLHLESLRLNEELQQRIVELRELDRLKSSFLANMSHELRTPLNSILGFSDVILEGLDGPLTENMDNDLRLIQKNGQHLLHLINDVLDMAKIESGRMNLHPEKFLVNELLFDVTSITSTLASDKNTALYIEADSDRNVEIYADTTRIRQVMINLVNNAIKFTNNGTIALKAVKLDGGRVLITVKDTGLGISHDHIESVFQEFTQVDSSTTRKAGGTGLGLPISRRLIEMHGGRLWAESTGIEGEGSTFFVELPVEARLTEVIERKER